MKKLLLTGAILLASIPMLISAADTGSTMMPGSDRDSHGCIGSAGYIWSESAQKCIRPWEQSGTVDPTNSGEKGIKDPAIKSCGSCGVTGRQVAPGTGTVDPTNSGEKGIKDNAVKSCGSCGLTGRQVAPGTGSGADIERETQGLVLAIGQLSPEQRGELMKMIRTYVESKGVKIPAPDQIQNMKEENKADRKEVNQEIRKDKKTAQEAAKQKREDMRKRMQERKAGLAQQ